MSLLSRLLGGKGGGGSTPGAEAVTHQGFTITPAPQKADGGYRLAAMIEKEVGGEMKSHHLIRADVLPSAEAASEAAIHKAKAVIDQLGDGLF